MMGAAVAGGAGALELGIEMTGGRTGVLHALGRGDDAFRGGVDALGRGAATAGELSTKGAVVVLEVAAAAVTAGAADAAGCGGSS
jgi:hypothetical protein